MPELKPPTGLRAPGKRLWAAVTSNYVLTPTELETLRQACGTADEVNRLEKALKSLEDLTVLGSTGQEKGHPLLAELRAHRVLLDRLMASLNIPDRDEEVGLRPGQHHARVAANARWKLRGVS
jgi:hypothetical protein